MSGLKRLIILKVVGQNCDMKTKSLIVPLLIKNHNLCINLFYEILNENRRKPQSLLIGKVFKLIKSATYKNFVCQNKLFHRKNSNHLSYKKLSM